MPAYSSAYSRLITRLNEIEQLLTMARAADKAPPSTSNRVRVGALCRGGVVLLSSHIEGYVEDLGTLAIERIETNKVSKASMGRLFRYHLSRDLIDRLRSSETPDRVVSNLEGLLSRDGHIWDSTNNFAPPLVAFTFIRTFSTPNHGGIKSFFGRFGFTQYEGSLAHRLTTNFSACKNMVDQVVEQRNKIAHGDPITTGTPIDLADMLRYVKLYCRSTDQVVGDWFRTVGCPIR